MPFFYGFDWTYIVYVLPPMIIAIAVQIFMRSTFKKYSRVASERGMTGYDAARLILDKNGLHHVNIETVAGELTDHYIVNLGVIRLSEPVHSASSIAAVGVAAHEAGHAVQHAEGYLPMVIIKHLYPITNIGSNLAFPLVLLGILLSFPLLANIGILLFLGVVLLQVVTLPAEFNASKRAIMALEEAGLSDETIRGTKKVLYAAALTYVASLAVAIGNLLRLLLLANRSKRS
jgi:Zn-dependent membrane protease YugP